MKYSESTLQSWTSPLSKTEEERAENTITMIKAAIYADAQLKSMDIEVFTQGSFANNTNVRSESDVDVCVMLKDTFFTEYPKNKQRSDYGFSDSNLKFQEYRDMVKHALVSKFGASNITNGNKAIKIDENTYHVKADVVPTFQLRNYYYHGSTDPNRYVEGTRFISKAGQTITNYPKVHIRNGIEKNKNTNMEYKKLVRLMKHIRNNMVDDQFTDGDTITSFLVECLVWNIPNSTITGYKTWTDTVRHAIAFLYNAIDDNNHTEWGEVSEMLYLFRGRKWTDQDAKRWLLTAWNYLGFAG